MDFIANYWYAWLALLVVSTVIMVVNQFQRFNRVSSSMRGDAMQDPFSQMKKGVGILAVAALLSWGSGILLLIAVIIHIIRYFN